MAHGEDWGWRSVVSVAVIRFILAGTTRCHRES